jgi:hypothetical protein
MASDDFNRADATLNSGNWAASGGSFGTLEISSNVVRKTGAGNGSSLARYPSSSELYSEVEITDVTGRDGGPAICIQSGADTFYMVTNYDGTLFHVFEVTGGSFSDIAQGSGTYQVGDIISIERDGNDVVAKKNSSEIVRVTDTTLTTGAPGMFIFVDNIRLDNWSDGAGGGGATLRKNSLMRLGVGR